MKHSLYFLLGLIIFISCDEVINPDLNEADAPLVIDAWLYGKPERQVITISRASTYFNQSGAEGISGAIVTVYDTDDPSNPIFFNENESGKYEWTPTIQDDSFGEIGSDYMLNIQWNEDIFYAFSTMNRVPKIDSITWRLEEANAFFDDSYFGEFWSRDLLGDGDTYWIKAWKNGEYLSKPSEIFVAYDAGFSPDGNADGFYFIQPIRDALNPFDFDENNQLLSPYVFEDSAYVEINSITLEAFFFLQQVQEQTNRPGGFGELFATPLSNVETNIFSDNSDEQVVGFFCVSAVSGLGRKFTEDAIFQD